MSTFWRIFYLGWVCGLVLATIACTGNPFTPPREATRLAMTAVPVTATPPPLFIPAPTPTGPAGADTPTITTSLIVTPSHTLTLWVNETSPAHAAALEKITADFTAQSGIPVALRLVEPALLPNLVATAVLSHESALPDLILHPIAYTMGWAEQGILDPNAAQQVINALQADTFDADALALVQVDGRAAAIPSDGWQQLIVYRTDWFTDRNLDTPDNYDAMLTAATTLYDRENLVAGFVVPTESNLISTQQIFEHLATANGCQLIDDDGRVRLLEPACQEALDFYYEIIHNYSPIGVQTDTSTHNAYLSGRAGLIIVPPDILLALAGLDNTASLTCDGCVSATGQPTDFLAQQSGFLTRIRGRNTAATAANYSQLTYLGITQVAETETAVAFARYWFSEGYETWLRVETERKVPLRWGTPDAPRHFIDAWGTYPLGDGSQSLLDIYGQETVNRLRDQVVDSNRWGLRQGQGTLITQLYQNLTFSIVLQEMLSGYFNPEKTLAEVYIRVIDLIPNYSYDLGVE